MSEQANGAQPETELATIPASRGVQLVGGDRGLQLRTLDEMWRFSVILSKSGMAPKDYQGKPDNCFIAIQLGQELGVLPMQAIQNIAVINGRPSVWGDLAMALVEASGLLQDKDEHFEGGDYEGAKNVNFKAVCVTTRRGRKPYRTEFSIADAKQAGLLEKSGPWSTNPKRMLQMRARGFNLRDNFPDVLKGMLLAEEAGDIIETTATRPEDDALEQRIAEAQNALSKGDQAAPAPAPVSAAEDTKTEAKAPEAEPAAAAKPARGKMAMVDPAKPAEEAKPTTVKPAKAPGDQGDLC